MTLPGTSRVNERGCLSGSQRTGFPWGEGGALPLTSGVCLQDGCHFPIFGGLLGSHWASGLADPPEELGICLRRRVL